MRFRDLSLLTLVVAVAVLCVPVAQAKPFSFSEAEERQKAEDQQEKDATRHYIQDLLDTPCSKNLKDRKTAIIIGERNSEGGYQTDQTNYGLHFAEINGRLRQLGMRTYTPEEIKAQIRAAETTAFLNNDPDAQISAASRLGASFILRGLIDSRTTFNPVVKVNEVHVTMTFTLVTSSGKSVASVTEESESYSGSDTTGTALALVREKADLVVAQLYSEYCQNAK